ncbi:MAG: hypothetical protein KM310_01590 [Clostridiales bacterium]|nr:hypothetical protein [Clostridiales bacterium]
MEAFLDLSANDPRLGIRDLETGMVRYFDALLLQSLVQVPDEYLLEACRLTIPQDEEEL